MMNEPKASASRSEDIVRAMDKAVRAALVRHKRLGESIAIWREGRVVVLSAEEIPLEDEKPAALGA